MTSDFTKIEGRSVRMDMYAWGIRYEFEQMSSYLDLIQTSLGQRWDEIDVTYRAERAREMTEDEYDWFEDHYTDKFLEIGRDFPRRLFSSFVVAWYSFMEQKLLDICERFEIRISIGPKDNKGYGKGITRARRFLLEGRQYEIHPPHWQELVEIRRLRNFIVHEGTRMVGKYFEFDEQAVALKTNVGGTMYFAIDQTLFRYLEKHKLFDHSGMSLHILPSYDYCSYLVEFGKELLIKVWSDLRPSTG